MAWVRSEGELAGEFSSSPQSPLHGLPYFAKDLYDVAGVPTHAGSSFLAEVRTVNADSALVARLRELGASLAGKTHLVEFAAGLTGENRTYGDCPHPRFPDRLSGGSSSGSAALVAAGVVPFALGTDTGGSVRVPAAFCSLFGYRGAPGDEFIRDAFPLSPTCDTAGWFTAHARDLRQLNHALLGAAERAATPRGVFLRARDLLPEADAGLDDACAFAAESWAARADSATIEELTQAWSDSVDAYATLVMSEANAIHRHWLVPHRECYDPGIWQRIFDAGSFPLEKIERARHTMAAVRESFARFFATHDFLALPCAPMPALTKAQCTPEARRNILTFTTPASLGGLPCLTVPVALPGGLTAGLQVLAAKPNSPVFDWLLRTYSRAEQTN